MSKPHTLNTLLRSRGRLSFQGEWSESKTWPGCYMHIQVGYSLSTKHEHQLFAISLLSLCCPCTHFPLVRSPFFFIFLFLFLGSSFIRPTSPSLPLHLFPSLCILPHLFPSFLFCPGLSSGQITSRWSVPPPSPISVCLCSIHTVIFSRCG